MTKALELEPEKSELEVFRKLSEKLITVPHQFDIDYQQARGHHSPQEIYTSLKRVKNSKLEALFTVQELADIQHAFRTLKDMTSEEKSSANKEDDFDTNYTSTSDIHERYSELYFSNTAYLNATAFIADVDHEIREIRDALYFGRKPLLDGIVFDTVANRQSAVCMDQYRS